MKASVFLPLILLIAGCSGSDVYRGQWKATDGSGARYEINFDAKKFTVADSTTVREYEYTQNSVKVFNSKRSYGIELKDGRKYDIIFPLANETTKGIIQTQESMERIYVISRNEYLKSSDIYDLK